jgi:hypothetical protein
MKTILISISTVAIIFTGCGSSRETSKNENSSTVQQASEEAPAPVASGGTTGEQPTPADANKVQSQDEKYRLVISFISIGEGTDPTAREKLNEILASWSQKAGKEIVMESHPWGREGEVDFCFHLNELSGQDQALMVREIREAFAGKPLIQISEYQKSMNKR